MLGTGASPDPRGVLAPGAPVAQPGSSERPGFPQSFFNLSRKRCQPVSTNSFNMCHLGRAMSLHEARGLVRSLARISSVIRSRHPLSPTDAHLESASESQDWASADIMAARLRPTAPA